MKPGGSSFRWISLDRPAERLTCSCSMALLLERSSQALPCLASEQQLRCTSKDQTTSRAPWCARAPTVLSLGLMLRVLPKRATRAHPCPDSQPGPWLHPQHPTGIGLLSITGVPDLGTSGKCLLLPKRGRAGAACPTSPPSASSALGTMLIDVKNTTNEGQAGLEASRSEGSYTGLSQTLPHHPMANTEPPPSQQQISGWIAARKGPGSWGDTCKASILLMFSTASRPFEHELHARF